MDKREVIQFFKEGDQDLSEESLKVLNETELDLTNEGLPPDFAVFTGFCRICGHTSLIICPSMADLDNLECGNCGNFTVQPTDNEEELEEFQKNNFYENRFFIS